MSVGIYIHVPFCAEKCPYCDFYSCSYTLKNARLYTDAITRDINKFPDRLSVDTIYFGGGTPSLLPFEFIKKILLSIYSVFELKSPEITIEVNPCTVNLEKLINYKKIGINRLSIGVQSASDRELEVLGRNYSFKKAVETIILSQNAGFNNISCDLMIGIPKQTKNSLENSINRLAALNIQHISSYILKIEKNTVFDNLEFIKQLPDDDDVSDMYLFMVDLLEKCGFKQYEISNFSKKGFESRHNLKYWQCSEYLGFGPAAHSFYNKLRYYYTPDLNSFFENSPEMNITDRTPGSDEEKIMLGLRLSRGIDLDDFPDKKNKILSEVRFLEKKGLIIKNENNIRLTPKGFLVSNSVISELIY